MQIDFHHTVTYILARLADFPHSQATTIAHAAQYVDDANNQGTIQFTDGSAPYYHYASAYGMVDINNLNNRADYTVWAPFHFLPGNNGDTASATPTVPLVQRLLCQPDSYVANRMWEECRKTAGDHNALHRLGITCHVYEDTFAHQRFAGIRHNVNSVSKIDAIDPTDDNLFDKAEMEALEFLRVGHGSAGKNPDMPFLNWTYQDAFHEEVPRDNPQIFLHACDRLFAQFHYYLKTDPNAQIAVQDRTIIESITRTTRLKDGEQRHQVWLNAIAAGQFYFGAPSRAEMADLNYVAKGVGSWKYTALGIITDKDAPGVSVPHPANFEQSDWYKFHEALKGHRSTVLTMLLPEFGLPGSVDDAKAAGLPL
jgi:hypothetical protein